ncbi:MAG: hypothetical protein KGL39_12340 [Patescibacteria group bacterium]|nr:hypothetical protein [Patescibacteria group bacterium]
MTRKIAEMANNSGQMFTVWVQDTGGGTIHISSHAAKNASEAAQLAVEETADDWEYDKARAASMLWVLGIAKGDVEIVEWNDE